LKQQYQQNNLNVSDTYSEDDRKPAAVENREPRDVEKGEGGGGRVKLPPSATTQSKRARSSSSRHKRSHKHSRKHKHGHRDKSSRNNLMVTTKRLPPPIFSARHMHPHPRRLIGVRQNLFLWRTT
jgi:hypothetical protein